MKLGYWLETLLQDVRYGFRSLTRAPLVALAVVLTLALGIGLNTAAFTLINGLVFRARVEKDPASFVQLIPQYSGKWEHEENWLTSVDDYRAYQAHARSVREFAAWGQFHATIDDDPSSNVSMLVTCNFFSLYGLARAKLGRLFRADECASPGGAPVVVISEEMWRRQFSADPHIIGRIIRLDRQSFTVVGVTPAGFPGLLKSGVWIPWTMQPAVYEKDFFRESSAPWLFVEGRLQPGYTRSAARAELGVIASQQDRLHPARKTKLFLTNGSIYEHPAQRGIMTWVVLFWMGLLTVVLLLTCTNVTTLLLSRAAARRQEIAVRLSLGAARIRLVRMLLTETLILAGLAGALSAYLAYRVPDILVALRQDWPHFPVQPDFTVFAYLGGITLLAACMAGLAPAAESLKVDLANSLKGHGSLLGASRWRLRDLLVAGQVATSLVLLAITGLVMRAQYDISVADPGFETRQVLLVPLGVNVPPYTADAAWSFYRTLEQRVRALPGVQSVCYAKKAPFWGDDEGPETTEEVRLPGQAKGTGRRASVDVVSTDFFETLRIPILRGRALERADANSQKPAAVTVVSENFARKLWPHEDPVGKGLEWADGERLEVVGVARDTKSQSYGSIDGPRFYVLDNPRSFGGPLMVRFSGDAHLVARAVRDSIRKLDPAETGVPRTLRSEIDDMSSRFRIVVDIFLLLGGITIFLAVVGIYGVVAFAVSRRTRELGIRMALGATKADIVRAVLGSGGRPVAAGLLGGSLIAIGGSVGLARVLQGGIAVRLWDPLIYSSVWLLLVGVAMGAMLGPALRAAGADPNRALRQD